MLYCAALGFIVLAWHAARYNEAKLKEMALDEDTAAHRQRASRIQKWRELAQEAAKTNSFDLPLPDALETLGRCVLFSPLSKRLL